MEPSGPALRTGMMLRFNCCPGFLPVPFPSPGESAFGLLPRTGPKPEFHNPPMTIRFLESEQPIPTLTP